MLADRAPGPAVMVYVPTPLPVVAAVVKLAEPLTTLAVSPLTKPVMLSVSVGTAAPYVFAAAFTVTVNGAGLTVNVPLVNVAKV